MYEEYGVCVPGMTHTRTFNCVHERKYRVVIAEIVMGFFSLKWN